MMRRSGAELIESTTDRAMMLAGAATQAYEHLKRLGRLKKWLLDNKITAFVPTDSPAANWSICAKVRRHQPEAKVVHLVAPQLWAWAPWRVKKLRRLTDHVFVSSTVRAGVVRRAGCAIDICRPPLIRSNPCGEDTTGGGSAKKLMGQSWRCCPAPGTAKSSTTGRPCWMCIVDCTRHRRTLRRWSRQVTRHGRTRSN